MAFYPRWSGFMYDKKLKHPLPPPHSLHSLSRPLKTDFMFPTGPSPPPPTTGLATFTGSCTIVNGGTPLDSGSTTLIIIARLPARLLGPTFSLAI